MSIGLCQKASDYVVTYSFNLLFEVVGVITILHEQHYLLLILCVVIQLHYVFVFKLRVDHALLTSVAHLHLINEFVFHDALLNDPLNRSSTYALTWLVSLWVVSEITVGESCTL
jgi:uncharacterized membrane protein YuzA (DUF378 family)